MDSEPRPSLDGHHYQDRSVTGWSFGRERNQPAPDTADLIRRAIDAVKLIGVRGVPPSAPVKALMVSMARNEGARAYLIGLLKCPYVSQDMRTAWFEGFADMQRLVEGRKGE
jgi:hypothetical protein